MVQLTQDQRIWVCIEMARLGNAKAVQRSWLNRWPGINAPTARTIRQNFKKYSDHGTSLNRNRGNSGRPRTARSVENVARVRRSLQRNGNLSARRNGLGISRASFSRIIRSDLRFYTYVLVKHQELKLQDPVQRLQFCHWFTNKCQEDPTFLSNLISSDEAIFSMNPETNRTNVTQYAKYGEGHPHNHYIEHAQGAPQLLVWVGVTGSGDVLGPHFVEGNLNTREYLRIVRYHMIQQDFRNLGIQREVMWWQQDGAPAHTSIQVINYLSRQFPDRLISKRGDVLWPPRSPDLTVLDFFVWGHIKQKIWDVPRNQQPANLNQLRAAIIRQFAALPRDMIQRLFNAMLDRCRKCIDSNGGCFDNE